MEAADIANINKAVSNIEHELSTLRQVIVTSRCKDVVSTAVRSLFQTLEPLRALNHIKSDGAEEDQKAPEEDSVYFEALDMIDKVVSLDTPRPVEGFKQGDNAPLCSGTNTQKEEVHEADARNTNALNDMPMECIQNASRIFESEEAETSHSVDMNLASPSIEVATEATSTRLEGNRITPAPSLAACNNSDAARRFLSPITHFEDTCHEPKETAKRNELSNSLTSPAAID